jgi:hypothetical protein
MARDGSVFDVIWFTVLSFCTIGGICALIAAGLAVVYHLELTPLDASILVWLVVALCISTFVLSSALFLSCCELRYGKLILAFLYAVLDLFILTAAIAILTLRPTIVKEIGTLWADVDSSALVDYLEGQFDCCGFDGPPPHNCKARNQTCFTVIDAELAKYSGIVGGALVGVAVLLLAAVIVSFLRAFARPGRRRESSKAQEMEQIQEKLTHEGPTWF